MTRIGDESKYYNKLTVLAERRGRRLGQLEPVHDVIPGIVYSLNGSIYVSGKGQDYVHVHEFGMFASNAHAYKPPGIIVWEGAGVIMKRSPKSPYKFEIIRTHVSPYPRTVISATQITRTGVSIHGINHQWPTEATKGPDPFSIWPPALAMLKSEADGLEVTVGPLAYLRGTTRMWFPTALVDLTPYLPASGRVLCALLSLGVDMGVIDVATGPTSNDPFGTFIPTRPETPAGNIPSGYFYLRGGATTLSMIDDYLDARLWLAGSAGGISAQQLSHVEAEFDYQMTDHVVNHPGGATSMAYGEMYITSTATTTISAQSTKSGVIDGNNYVKAAGTTTAGDLSDWSMPANNRLRYDGATTKNFLVQVHASLEDAGSFGDNHYCLKIAKDGTVIDHTFAISYVHGNNEIWGISTAAIISGVAQNEYLELFLANENNTDDPILSSMIFTAVEIL